MLASVLLGAGLTIPGVMFARKYPWRNRLIEHNDVAGPILTTVGTVLAVMLSFMVVGVWQEYDAAAQTAQAEASAASDVHHIADGFAPAMREHTQSSIDRYVTLVVRQEWPRMRAGEISSAAHDEIYGLERSMLAWQPTSQHDQGLQSRALDRMTSLLDARRDRILANREGIPLVLWATMLVLGSVTVLFSFYFRVDRAAAHAAMVAALGAILALTFALIAELDFPFRGDMAVAPDAFTQVESLIHLDRKDSYDPPIIPIARAAKIASVTSERTASAIISILPRRESGNVSAGLNAAALVNARNR